MGRSGLRVQELKEQAPRSTSSYQCRRHPAWVVAPRFMVGAQCIVAHGRHLGDGVPQTASTISRSPHYSFAFCPSLFVAAAASACFFTSRGACCSQKRKVRPPDKSWAYAAGSPQVSHRPTWVFTAFIATICLLYVWYIDMSHQTSCKF